MANILFLTLALIAAIPAQAASKSCPAPLDFKLTTLQGQPANLCRYSGQVVLVVNTASYCAFTQQYAGLEALYRKDKPRGLVVLGFPSNDFGSQEPGSSKDVANFCRMTYGVQFPMFAKSSVKGTQANPVFSRLIAITGKMPQWNFHKYLISRDGKTVQSFDSAVTPEDPAFLSSVERLLSEKTN